MSGKDTGSRKGWLDSKLFGNELSLESLELEISDPRKLANLASPNLLVDCLKGSAELREELVLWLACLACPPSSWCACDPCPMGIHCGLKLSLLDDDPPP